MNKNFSFIFILLAIFSVVTANGGYESCYENDVPDLSVDFQPDPISSPGT
ncbi:29121_t:CDS:1, partial [Gigaspora margarita]